MYEECHVPVTNTGHHGMPERSMLCYIMSKLCIQVFECFKFAFLIKIMNPIKKKPNM